PHGHWADGRFHDVDKVELKRQLASGAEKFQQAGRSPMQARCVQLARMGCVVFHYDMIGYADSKQLTHRVTHGFPQVRPEMDKLTDWGLFSPQAESHLQGVMGLQTYSSMRALDFLASLPDVDRKRLAVTGASGGGTQSFMISAVDPRLAVSMPAVMVSTSMQGGCTCENCCLLRINAGNVDFAALFAPKPLGLTAANDWTKEMETKGFPELKKLYSLLGKPENVMLASNVQFDHNYNAVSRAAMYEWFNQHLKLNADTTDRDYEYQDRQSLTVWNDEHPRPPAGVDFERKLVRWWTDDTRQQLEHLIPSDQKSLKKFREIVGGGVAEIIGRHLPYDGEVEFKEIVKDDRGVYFRIGGLLRNKQQGETLPILFLHPKEWNGRVVIWIDKEGKAGLYRDDHRHVRAVQSLLSSGTSVVGVDLLYQGEFLRDGKALEKTRWVPHTRRAASYTFAYNHSLFAQRVHDILSVVTFVVNHDLKPTAVDLVGFAGAGPWVAAARTQTGDAIRRTVVDTGGFRFGQVNDLHSLDFLPGGSRYFDLPGMLALAAPGSLWLAGEEEVPQVVADVYKAAGAQDRVVLFRGDPNRMSQEAVAWLLKIDRPKVPGESNKGAYRP
ncbi:MAG: acetylxylan esterase, partial [Pirellulales bacterium]